MLEDQGRDSDRGQVGQDHRGHEQDRSDQRPEQDGDHDQHDEQQQREQSAVLGGGGVEVERDGGGPPDHGVGTRNRVHGVAEPFHRGLRFLALRVGVEDDVVLHEAVDHLRPAVAAAVLGSGVRHDLSDPGHGGGRGRDLLSLRRLGDQHGGVGPAAGKVPIHDLGADLGADVVVKDVVGVGETLGVELGDAQRHQRQDEDAADPHQMTAAFDQRADPDPESTAADGPDRLHRCGDRLRRGQKTARPQSSRTAGSRVIITITAHATPMAPAGPSARLSPRSLNSRQSRARITVPPLEMIGATSAARRCRRATFDQPPSFNCSR